MDETGIQYSLSQAEIALNNGQYETALQWYRTALEKDPGNLTALSRAGAVCMALERYDEAMDDFQRAVDADPDNGDNYFNLGNAYFFRDQYQKAFEYYVDAKEKGCSEETIVRLYYQMALLCSIRNDIKSALLYMRMCEDADPSGRIASSADLLSEKAKLYMALEDYDNAERAAAQTVAAAPAVFANYMVYFAILMGQRKFSAAQNILRNAEQYADKTEDDHSTLAMQWASVYTALAEAVPDLRASYYEKAAEALNMAKGRETASQEQRNELDAALAEVYLKTERNDEAIRLLTMILHKINRDTEESVYPDEAPDIQANKAPEVQTDPDQVLDMMDADMERIEEMIRRRELVPDMHHYVKKEYDAAGNPVYQYPEGIFDSVDGMSADNMPDESETDAPAEIQEADISADFRDRVYFLLLSAFLANDDFAGAEKAAALLKHSENDYYGCYGLYAQALSVRRQNRDPEKTEHLYAETIAYFRSRSFSNPRDTLASIFRARLYAEDGKYAKAAEIANLLSDTDRQSVLNYIETCKQDS